MGWLLWLAALVLFAAVPLSWGELAMVRLRGVRIQGLALLAAWATWGCGSSKSSGCETLAFTPQKVAPGYTDPKSTSAGLAFTTVDSAYTASKVWLNDLHAGEILQLDSGESGDPFLKVFGSQLFLFNRQAAQLNFLSYSFSGEQPSRSCQVATPGAGTGDPQDALLLDAHRMLLAQGAAGSLVVIDPTTGDVVQTVSATWGLAAGAPFRPAAFYQVAAADGSQTIYVLHQGLDQNYQPNGTQRLFVLKDDGTQVTVTNAPGLPLKLTNPLGILGQGPAGSGSLLVYGECTEFNKLPCTAGYEQVTTATGDTSVLFETRALGFLGNGKAVQGPGTTAYELMVKPDGKTAVVERLDYVAKKATDAYTFTGPKGCCGLYFDSSSGSLVIGDTDASGQSGTMTVLLDGATSGTPVALPGIAYTGAFVGS